MIPPIFRRRSTPPAAVDLPAVQAAAQAAQDAADAAHRIAAVAERQAAIIGAQADEIARLRRELAEQQAATRAATEAAGYWYQQARTAARRDLPAILADNLGRFVSRN